MRERERVVEKDKKRTSDWPFTRLARFNSVAFPSLATRYRSQFHGDRVDMCTTYV